MIIPKTNIILSMIAVCVLSAGLCWADQGVPVLMYHDFITTEDLKPGRDVMPLDLFERQMKYLADAGYSVLSMDELIAYMKGDLQVPAKSVVLNFDDGWRRVANVLPILEAHNFKASFWVLAAGESYGDAYLNWDQIIRIDQHPDFEVGSHTVTHPWNPDSNLVTWIRNQPEGKTTEDARKELVDSKRILESKLNRPIKYLAWPCGWYNDQLMQMAKDAGYQALLTITSDFNRPGDSVLEIKRFFVDGACSLETFVEMVETGIPKICELDVSQSHEEMNAR